MTSGSEADEAESTPPGEAKNGPERVKSTRGRPVNGLNYLMNQALARLISTWFASTWKDERVRR